MQAPLRIWAISQAAAIPIAAELDMGKLVLIMQAVATICVAFASVLKTYRDRPKPRKPRATKQSKGGEIL